MKHSRIVAWRDLRRWLPPTAEAFTSEYPAVPLGDVLNRRETAVLAADFANFTPISVAFTGRITARDRPEPFQGAMFAVLPGDLVFSKIDVRNGAIGLLPDKLGPAVVTSEYPIYTADPSQVEAGYLALLLRTAPFRALLRDAASGTSGRKRVAPADFEELEVPLPDPAEQQRLVAAHRQARKAAAALEAEATAREQAAITAFEAALGLTPPPDLPRRRAFISRWQDFERWSAEGVTAKEQGFTMEAAFPVVALEDAIADLRNGWSPKCHSYPATGDEWGVLKVGAVSMGVFRERQNKALPADLTPLPDLQVQAGDVLIGRANILRLVGACAIVREIPARLMLCDKIFRVVFEENSPIDPEYLVEVLKTPALRLQIETAATGTSPTMKNISKAALMELLLPLPASQEVQRELVYALRADRAAAHELRREAAALRAAADGAFAGAVFGVSE